MIKITMYPAQEGDSFLLQFGDSSEYNILVDMGMQQTYLEHIKPDLIKLSQDNNDIDLLIVTHVDQDHIQGAIKFIEDNENCHKIIEVKEVWHNSYRHFQLNKVKRALSEEEEMLLTQIKNQNKVSVNSGISDISIPEGITLSGLLYKFDYCWNESFNGLAASSEGQDINLSSDITLKIISPNTKKLNRLATDWKRKLESEKYGFTLNNDELFDDAFELYMQQIKESAKLNDISESETPPGFEELINLTGKDNSPTNGSSLAFIIEYKSKKLLFLGDAHEDIIYEQLLLLKSQGYDLDFDVVKVSHHGSNNNISNRILKILKSNRYLISTDGVRHSHPDLSTIAKIIAADHEKEIITNYEHHRLDYFKHPSIQNKYKFKILTSNEIIIE